MEILKDIPNEIKFKIFKYQSHPVAVLLKQRINSYNNSKNMFDNFFHYWCYDRKLYLECNESKKCMWCGKGFKYGDPNEHECHECFLRISLDCNYKMFCDGCDGKYCYKCFMQKSYRLDCSCKFCNCILTDPDKLCYDCYMTNNV